MTSALNHQYPRIEGEEEAAPHGAALEYEDEDEYEDEAFLGQIAQSLGGLLGEGEQEAEYEFEFEAEAEAESAAGELEDEAFVNPVRRVYPDAELMAHLSSAAAEAESELEAEAFIGALIPLVSRLIPRAATLVSRNAPALIRGTTQLAHQLRRQPRTRRLVRALPVVLQRTAQSLADQAVAGKPVTGRQALQTLGDIARQIFADPADCGGVISAVGTFDRRYHRRHHGQAHTRTSGSRPVRRSSRSAGRRARRRY
jgi:hypothetical protein